MNDILKSKSIEEIKLCMRYDVYKCRNLGSQYKNEEKEFIKKYKENNNKIILQEIYSFW